MVQKKQGKKKPVKQELDMVEHSARLRAIPSGSWEAFKRWVIVITAGVVLVALMVLALGR